MSDITNARDAYASKNEDELKNEDDLINEDDLKNEDNLKKMICPPLKRILPDFF